MAVKTNCTINGKKYYRVTASIGKDSNGKLIRKNFYGKNKSDAEQKRDEYLNNLEKGLTKNYNKLELGKIMHIWLWEVMKIKLKPTTFERYEGIYRKYIKEKEIYSWTLNDIKPLDMQRYYNSLIGIANSHEQFKIINRVFKAFFNYCVNNGFILNNPVAGSKIVIPLKKEETEISIYEDNEIKLIAATTEQKMIRWIALASLCTGMRRGEVLGLTWDNIHYKTNEIDINKTLKTICIYEDEDNKKWLPQFQVPKTKGSIRKIPLTQSFLKILDEVKAFQKSQKDKLKDKYEDNNLIFCKDDGKMIDDKKIQRQWAAFCKRNNIPYKNFHALRHTYATIQFENNVPLKTVSALLGHSDIRITANTYTHVLKKHKEVAVDVLSLY